MAKKESTFINMVSTLFIVAFVSSSALGYVYELTKGPIAGAMLAKKVNAVKTVLPAFDNNPVSDKFVVGTKDGPLTFYPAKKDGKDVGTAIETFTKKGFGGEIKLMIGILPDGDIYNIAVLEQKETPGLGDKMEVNKSDFMKQFKGKSPSNFSFKVKKDGGDVDAITAATISSRAFCDAVNRAFNVYKKETK